MAELGRLLLREVLFLGGVQVLFHLLHDMLGLVEVLNIQVRRGLGNLVGVAALRAELPLLEPVNVRKRPAGRAPDDKVHDNEVICPVVINKYRTTPIKAAFRLRVGGRFLQNHGIPPGF